jgi:uncharacterized protein
MSRRWLREAEGGVELDLLIQPRASRTCVVGEHDGRLKLMLAASPVDGEANAALLRHLSALLCVPPRQLELLSGKSSRRKRLRVWGLDAARVEAVINICK